MCIGRSLVLVAMALAVSAFGQDARGRMIGLVTDGSGAVVPNAAITATHTEMNMRVSTRSNETGYYELPYLLPGVYRLVVEMEGFKRYQREPIEIRVAKP